MKAKDTIEKSGAIFYIKPYHRRWLRVVLNTY